jgi:heme exporter protein D
MAVLIWIGAGLTLLGVLGLVWSAVIVVRARRAGLDEAALRARMGQALPLNVGALLLSLLGLMCVVVGVILG